MEMGARILRGGARDGATRRENACPCVIGERRCSRARHRADRGVVGGQARARETERVVFAKSRQVASVELCSYFPSTHPMMSTVM